MVTIGFPLLAIGLIVLLVKAFNMKLVVLLIGGAIALAAAPPSWGQMIQTKTSEVLHISDSVVGR